MSAFCLHETATSGAAWKPFEEALGDRLPVVAPGRLGWREDTPEGYLATTIDEQAEDAAALVAGVAASAARRSSAAPGSARSIALDLRSDARSWRGQWS